MRCGTGNVSILTARKQFASLGRETQRVSEPSRRHSHPLCFHIRCLADPHSSSDHRHCCLHIRPELHTAGCLRHTKGPLHTLQGHHNHPVGHPGVVNGITAVLMSLDLRMSAPCNRLHPSIPPSAQYMGLHRDCDTGFPTRPCRAEVFTEREAAPRPPKLPAPPATGALL